MKQWLRVAVWLLILLSVGLGCEIGRVSPEKWNVVFIVVDTLRADHLSMYGYDRPTSPALEAFSREAIVFEEARSQAGCTFPSVNSLLTSQYPQVFVQDMNEHGVGISERWPTLAEMLKSEGYRTAAVSSSPIVRANPSKYNPDGGFDAGFDTFDDTCMKQPAECVNARAFEVLDDVDSPYFLYLHYMEPHMPYQPPATHGPVFLRFQSGPHVTDADLKPFLVTRKIWALHDMLYEGDERIEFTDADIARMINLYDEEIHYFDAQFDKLMQRLEAGGAADRTIIILASDHGEELLDHGHIWHCRDLTFDTVARTPLVIKIPGVEQVGSRGFMVQNLDIIPTLLDYLGIDPSRYDLQGSSLRPVITREEPLHEHLFYSQRYARSVTDGRYKLVYDINTGETSLYDLQRDPTEQSDMKARRPEVAELLGQVLLDWIEEVEGENELAERVLLEREVNEMLQALGYLGYSDEDERQQAFLETGLRVEAERSPPPFATRVVEGLRCGSLDGAVIDDHGRVFVWGWAYDPRVNEPARGVVILVDGTPLDLTIAVDKERPDVAEFFEDDTRRVTGWNVRVNRGRLSPGEHEVQAYAVFSDGKLGRLVNKKRSTVRTPE